MRTLGQRSLLIAASAIITLVINWSCGPSALAQQYGGKKPNIVFIMGDDVGWFNIGAYHRGIMSGKTPNLDELAAQGMMFTDYYAEASCTAGRANFITGEIPLRTGLTTVGQAGADVGIPAKACTLATALKAQGYATGQFGKNHLGDLNKFLPTVHGFDEFFGYLYHLDAMSDPYWYSFPDDQAYRDKYGPRHLVHCYATDTDDPTEQPRWGRVGKQRIVDEGPLPPFPDMSNVPNMHNISERAKYDMTTFDEVLIKSSCEFMDKSKRDGKPFFVWHNTTRMHVWTFLSPKYQAMMNSQTNYGLEEAGMAQMDDSIGAILKHIEDIGETENTIVVFSTDNGAEVFTWPDGGMTPFKATKGTVMEGGFRVPCIVRWPGHIKPGTVQNEIFSGLDWFPTLVAAAGNPNITDQLLKGVTLGDRTYKNHLDGYNQLDLLTGQGPSKRHEIWYFGGPKLGAIRLDDFKFQFYQQPLGWPGPKVTTDMPGMVNIRQDPFERTPSINGETLNNLGGGYMNDFYAREFWRFVLVQQRVAALAMTAIDYPPMQDPASFNLDAVKKQIDDMIKGGTPASKRMISTAGGSLGPLAVDTSHVRLAAFSHFAVFDMWKRLLTVMALVEVGTGVALFIAPSRIVELLVGEGLTSPQSMVLGRVTGAALFSIGVACWLTSKGEASGFRALVGGMLIYNIAVPMLLIHAAIVLGMHGIVLWPASILHVGLAIWCVICLRRRDHYGPDIR